MGIGPKVECYRCGKIYFGGKGYERGIRNFCYDCLVLKVNKISSDEFDKLGVTQKGFINMIHEMGGFTAAGGKDFWLNFLKENAGEIEENSLNNDIKLQHNDNRDNNGGSALGYIIAHISLIVLFLFIELIVIIITVKYGMQIIVVGIIGIIISLVICGFIYTFIDSIVNYKKYTTKL
jgi:hypothetical protein